MSIEHYTDAFTSVGEGSTVSDPTTTPHPENWRTRRFRISINRNLFDKSADKVWHGKGFHPRLVTIDELASEITSGHAYSFEYENDRRSKKYFRAADFISVDIDHGLTLDEAKSIPIVGQCASIIYTTASHTEAAHRFRIVFALARTLTDPLHVEAAAKSLASRLGGDQRATDAARLCYGNSSAQIEVFNRGIPETTLDELVSQTINIVGEDRAGNDTYTRRSELTISKGHRIRAKDGRWGSIFDFADRTSVHCPFHQDKSPSAVVYVNGGGRRSIHCFACNQSFWTDFPSVEHPAQTFDNWTLREEKSTDGQNIHVFSSEFLPPIPLKRGLNLIKSPKGSGKTELLARQIPETATVLLVGHRKALLRHMCKRLGLECYLDLRRGPHTKPARRLGVSLDSITRYKMLLTYDYVLVDESEQVLAHFIAETVGEKRHGSLRKFIFALRSAGTVVALDADLSTISLNFLTRWSSKDGVGRNRFIYFNKYSTTKGSITVYPSRERIIEILIHDLSQGKRCFLASNSKKYVDSTEQYIQSQLPGVKLVSVTADTAKLADDPAGRFFFDPVGVSQEHQLVLTTPAVSSGVDITFDGNAVYFDCVYGVFEREPTDHFECDQQISRVRHPGEIKVYISSQRSHLEIDATVVESDLRRSDLFSYLAADDSPAAGDLLELAVAVHVAKRISKNQLKDNFLRHKEAEGWTIKQADGENSSSLGSEALKHGQIAASTKLITRLMNAPRISPEKARQLRHQKDRQGGITRDERDMLRRAEIESFFRCNIFPELIVESEAGDWRGRVKIYEMLTGEFDATEIPDPESGVFLGSAGDAAVKSKILQNWTLRTAFEKTPIYSNGVFRSDVEYSANDLVKFKDFMIRHKEIFRIHFDVAVRRDIQTAPARQLSALLKMAFLQQVNVRTERRGSQKIYYYRLDEKTLQSINNLVRIRRTREPLDYCLE